MLLDDKKMHLKESVLAVEKERGESRNFLLRYSAGLIKRTWTEFCLKNNAVRKEVVWLRTSGSKELRYQVLLADSF